MFTVHSSQTCLPLPLRSLSPAATPPSLARNRRPGTPVFQSRLSPPLWPLVNSSVKLSGARWLHSCRVLEMPFVAPARQLLFELSMGARWSTFGFQFICLIVLILCSCLRCCSSLNSEGMNLLKFRERVYYDPYDSLASWNPDVHDPCVWLRVHCVHGKVQTLDLSELSLQGTLAPEIGNLSDLKTLILRGNHFSGPFPREFGSLSKLEVLDLRENSLSGEVPAEITRMVSLKHLLLCGNKFEGSVPSYIGDINSLLVLQFDATLEAATPGVGCIERKFDRRSKVASNPLGQGDAHGLHQNLQTSYKPRVVQNVAFLQGSFTQRKLLDQTSNLQAIPAKVGPPAQIISFPMSRGSGSFPAVANRTKASHPKASHPNAPLRDPMPLPSRGTETKLSNPGKIWIYVSVALGLALLAAICTALFCMTRKRMMKSIGPWKTGISGQLQKAFVTGVPKLNRPELETASEDFSNIIETRDGCTIYKGTLSSGVEIAIASTVATCEKDWWEESEVAYRRSIETLSRVNHKNFVNLLGYCEQIEPFTRMMVYEYAPNGTLFEHLHVKELEHLDWGARMRIIMGVAYCLQHMHGLNPPVVHSYLSSNVIYLTDDYAAKISERVFTKLPKCEEIACIEDEEKDADLLPSSSLQSNVHNFGVLLLEIITGKVPRSMEHGLLLNWASEYLSDKRSYISLVDPTLKSFKNEELEVICEVIKDCIKPSARQRPTMREATDRLKEALRITADAAVPRLSPLWWAELEILSVEAA